MRTRHPPRILLPIHKRQTIIRDIIAAILINSVRIRRSGDIKSFTTDNCRKGEIYEAGYERERGIWYAGAGLEVAPLGAVLVGPGAPGLGDVGLGVEGCVVGVVAGVDVRAAACYQGCADPACEVEEGGCEGCGLVGPGAGVY